METWLKFVSEFTKGICNTEICLDERGHYILKTSKIFDFNFYLTTKYGFLEVVFTNDESKSDFLAFASISKNTFNVNSSVKIQTTNWDASNFPCRVFVVNKKIQFYDKTNDLDIKEKFERRVTVLQSIFKIMIDMKLHNSR